MVQPIEQFVDSRLRWGLFQFGVISGLEGAPSRGIPVEPTAQSVARRDFLQPEIDLCALARQPARPQPVHQYAEPVRRIRRLIDALDMQGPVGHFAAPPTSHRAQRTSPYTLARCPGTVTGILSSTTP